MPFDKVVPLHPRHVTPSKLITANVVPMALFPALNWRDSGGKCPAERQRDRTVTASCWAFFGARREENFMNNIVWWVGAIVIVLAILGYLGFR